MPKNLLEQLSSQLPPPVPAEFDGRLRRRLNHRLLLAHLVDFVFRAVPYALLHLLRAAWSLVAGVPAGPSRETDRPD